ncbi:DUF4214 domain-containing protein [Balneatrix alpica]|uniref:DUF4214 domain-containing protein n=1 Tax=Balneatrix alpica TaxID=75684 RepID=UPI00273A2FBB|nr:DUF4214 domain-containing protein [Balneatrix alpica]
MASKSGIYYIDALLSDYSWPRSYFDKTTITYSFPFTSKTTATFSSSNYGSKNELDYPMYGFNNHQKAMTKQALQQWANVANLNFVEVDEAQNNLGTMRFFFTKGAIKNYWGHAYYPGKNESAGDIWVNYSIQDRNNFDAGTYNYLALNHEIGHALGLEHPFENQRLPSYEDNYLYTLMSYNYPQKVWFYDSFLAIFGSWEKIIPTGPSIYDIAAIQELYGANFNYNSGNNEYKYSNEQPFYRTIWDGGGIDTINLSNFSTNCRIDLRPGSFSDLYIKQDTPFWGSSYSKDTLYTGEKALAIAYNCWIENLISGSGDDTVFDNISSNNIKTDKGNDTIHISSGNDNVDGGIGFDTVILNSLRSSSEIKSLNNSLSITHQTGTLITTNVERIKFLDKVISFDFESANSAGGIYRLYQAAFNRKPDDSGLGYWIKQAEKGASTKSIAESFIYSQEFKQIYQVSPIDKYLSNHNPKGVIEKFYINILNREPDYKGLDYYTNQTLYKSKSLGQVLAEIADSNENRIKLSGKLSEGIEYIDWYS